MRWKNTRGTSEKFVPLVFCVGSVQIVSRIDGHAVFPQGKMQMAGRGALGDGGGADGA